jgi:hypothetical protein
MIAFGASERPLGGRRRSRTGAMRAQNQFAYPAFEATTLRDPSGSVFRHVALRAVRTAGYWQEDRGRKVDEDRLVNIDSARRGECKAS